MQSHLAQFLAQSKQFMKVLILDFWIRKALKKIFFKSGIKSRHFFHNQKPEFEKYCIAYKAHTVQRYGSMRITMGIVLHCLFTYQRQCLSQNKCLPSWLWRLINSGIKDVLALTSEWLYIWQVKSPEKLHVSSMAYEYLKIKMTQKFVFEVLPQFNLSTLGNMGTFNIKS